MKVSRADRLADVAKGMSVRNYEREDYKTAQKWWMRHNQAYLEQYLLPELGVVVERDGEPIAMSWIYMSNSALAEIGWVVTDPDLGPKSKMVALIKLFNASEDIVRSMGYRAVQILSDRPALSKFAVATDYRKVRPHDFLIKYLHEEDDDV